ncbi:MAG: hypothetical protein LQ351_001096 [Letrouitia transgressa]|nr:MAG: hypothetical protein LQ351_001096 [Letrouitia transgressa]
MKTSDYLTRYGWLGDGHTLHPSGRGIKKPLSISQKDNTFGLGKDPHEAISNLWWEKAYEETLKNININPNSNSAGSNDKEENGRKSQDSATVSGETLQIGLSYSKGKRPTSRLLYGHFTKGESLGGTFGPKDAVTHTPRDRRGLEANCSPDTARLTAVDSKHMSKTSSKLTASRLICKKTKLTLSKGQVSSVSMAETDQHVQPKLEKESRDGIQAEQPEPAHSSVSPDESKNENETAGKSKASAKRVKLSKRSKKDRKHDLEKSSREIERARRKRRKAKKAHKKEKSIRNERS